MKTYLITPAELKAQQVLKDWKSWMRPSDHRDDQERELVRLIAEAIQEERDAWLEYQNAVERD